MFLRSNYGRNVSNMSLLPTTPKHQQHRQLSLIGEDIYWAESWPQADSGWTTETRAFIKIIFFFQNQAGILWIFHSRVTNIYAQLRTLLQIKKHMFGACLRFFHGFIQDTSTKTIAFLPEHSPLRECIIIHPVVPFHLHPINTVNTTLF